MTRYTAKEWGELSDRGRASFIKRLIKHDMVNRINMIESEIGDELEITNNIKTESVPNYESSVWERYAKQKIKRGKNEQRQTN